MHSPPQQLDADKQPRPQGVDQLVTQHGVGLAQLRAHREAARAARKRRFKPVSSSELDAEAVRELREAARLGDPLVAMRREEQRAKEAERRQRREARRVAAEEAYRQAEITAADVDLAEVHDCFTIAEIVAMEDLGLAAPGEAVDLIRDGQTALGGSMPVNVSGGLKAGGHAIGATGVGQVYEAVRQLRGEAGDRQVAGAGVAVTHNVGGVGGTCAVQVLGRP